MYVELRTETRQYEATIFPFSLFFIFFLLKYFRSLSFNLDWREFHKSIDLITVKYG
mgnify:CR=1 FL=1